MAPLAPLETLLEAGDGIDVPLPGELAALYGPLRFPAAGDGPYVISNFVTSLDGVAALSEPGLEGGAAISGHDAHDRAVMGLLRAVADVVIVGAGTLRSVPRHLWTAEHIFPDLAGPYGRLRAAMGKDGPPWNVIVTSRGGLDPVLPVFRSGPVKAMVVTTREGRRRIRGSGFPSSVVIEEAGEEGPIGAGAVLSAVGRHSTGGICLVEGGPTLMGDFLAERRLDELFLTLAPQVAGRDGSSERPGFASGKRFLPGDPVWATLAGVKRAGSHLFLRYAFRGKRKP